jgi:hypothetical protein
VDPGRNDQKAARSAEQDRPIALSEWITGVLRVHFADGHLAQLAMSHAEALRITDMIERHQSDELLWSDSHWFEVRPDRIDLMEWVADRYLGWEMRRGDVTRFRANGYRQGPLKALADLWGEHEPSFSPTALGIVGAAGALKDGAGCLERIAPMLEGSHGALRASWLLDRLGDPDGLTGPVLEGLLPPVG